MMTDQEQKELEKLRKQKQKQLKRQNEYAAANYDRIAFVAKKGDRDIIREHYTKKGYKSLAEYFLTLAKKDGCQIAGTDEKPEEITSSKPEPIKSGLTTGEALGAEEIQINPDSNIF